MYWESKGAAFTLTVSVFQNTEEDVVLGAQCAAWRTAPCFSVRLSGGLPNTAILVIDTTSLNNILT